MHQQTWVDFKAVKEKVNMEMVLEHYDLLKTLTRTGERLSGVCPIHKGTKKGQFSVNVVKNAFKCFSTDCSKAGNQIDFTAAMEGVTFREAAVLLQEWFSVKPEKKAETTYPVKDELKTSPKEKGKVETTPIQPPQNAPLTFQLNLDPKHSYFAERGLTPETVVHFGLGFCSKGSMKDRIAIPIHIEKGELVAYAGRWAGKDSEIPEGEGKYALPKGFHKGLLVYNLNRIPEGTKRIILVEGYWSVYWLHQNGMPNVVSCMGSTISKEQVKLIADRFKGVQIFFDGDDAGKEGAKKVALELLPHLYIKLIECPQGLQPDRLPLHELKKLLT